LNEVKEMTQTEKVFDMLSKNTFVCGVSFQQEFIPTYAQRISDLNKKSNDYVITGQKCSMPNHSHKGNVFMYSMVRKELVSEQTSFVT
tara:strand:+ start:1077 stop:1340 length:264 start_codon:yes stop_codon:yes gene_type:complete